MRGKLIVFYSLWVTLGTCMPPAFAAQDTYCKALNEMATKVAVEMRRGAPLEAAVSWAESADREIDNYIDNVDAVVRPLVYYVYRYKSSSYTSPNEIGKLVYTQCQRGVYGQMRSRSANTDGQSWSPEPGAEGSYSLGTGWPIAEGLVVTNNHVIDGKHDITLLTANGTRLTATILSVDPENDLALLRPQDPRQLPTALPVTETVAPLGAQVFTIGFPHPDIMGSAPKLTTGVINALSGLHDDKRTYQISVAVQSGNSGGPLVNMKGEVVGVVTSKLSAVQVFRWTGDLPQNVNYALKTQALVAMIRRTNLDMVNEESRVGRASLEDLARRVTASVILIVAK